MRKLSLLPIAVVLALLTTGSSRADYVLEINRVGIESVTQGTDVSFDVSLTLPSLTPEQNLTAFSLFMDIAAPQGKGLPLGLGPISVSNYFPGFSSTKGSNVDSDLADALSSSNFDFSVNAENASGTAINTASNKTLFRLTINTGTLQDGTYSLIFRDDPIGDDASLRDIFPPFTGGDFGNAQGNSVLTGSFTVVGAVPEPGSLALTSIVLGLTSLFRRRKRNSKRP